MPFKSRIRQDIFLSAKDLQRTGLKCRMLFVDADRFFVECDQFLIFMSPRIGSSVIRICKSTDTSLITIIYRRSSDPGHLHNNRFTHNRFIHILVRSFRSQMFHTANLLPSTLSVTTSFLAVYLTFRRSAYFALAYASNDIVLIALWVLASLADTRYLSVVVCFAAFLVNDLYGFINWRRMKERQRA